MDLCAGPIQNSPQAGELRRQVVWKIANEKPAVVRQVGIGDATVYHIVIEIPDDVMAEKAAAGDNAEADIRVAQGLENAIAVNSADRVQNNGEREGGTFAVFALQNEALVAGK
jgi:hypothetical protein